MELKLKFIGPSRDFIIIVINKEGKVTSNDNLEGDSITLECEIDSVILLISNSEGMYYLYNSFLLSNLITEASIRVVNMRSNKLISTLESNNNTAIFKNITNLVNILQCGSLSLRIEFIKDIIKNVRPPPDGGIIKLPNVTPEVPMDTRDVNDLWWIVIPIFGVIVIVIVLIIVFFLLDKKQKNLLYNDY